jgi:hypothetical protein
VWGHQPVDGCHLLLATFRRARPAACLEGGEGSQWINARDGSGEIDAWTGMADPHAATSGEIDAWTGEVALEDAGKTLSPPSSPSSAPRIAAALPPSSQVRGAACGSLAALVGEAGRAARPLYSCGPSGSTKRVSGTGWPSGLTAQPMPLSGLHTYRDSLPSSCDCNIQLLQF